MISVMSLFRDNRTTLWMLVLCAAFYAFLFNMSQTAPESAEGEELRKTEILSKEQIKQKEEDFKRNIQEHPALIGGITLTVLAALLAGLGLDLHFLGRKLGGLPVWKNASAPPPAGWGPKEVLHLFILLFLLEAFIILAEMTVFAAMGVKDWDRDALLMANSLLRNLIVAVCAVLWARRRFGASFAAVGLTLKEFGKNIRRGLVAYVAILPVLFAMVLVMAWLAKIFSYEPEPQAVVQMYLKASSDKTLLFFTLFVALIGPAIEEVFFRGFAYSAFRSRWGVRTAVIVSAALFAVLHMNFVALVPIFVLGVCLAYLYEKTGSLVPSMTLHMTHNFIMVIAALFFRGIAS